MIETHPAVILLAAILTPALTALLRKVSARVGPTAEKIRPILPMIATALSIGLVSAGMHIAEADVTTWETAWNGLLAGGMSVWLWSQGRELKKKIDDTKKTIGGPGRGGASTLFVGGLLLLTAVTLPGCSGATPTLGELIPQAQIGRTPGGCLEVTVEQPVPVVEGWEVTTTTRVTQKEGCQEDDGAEEEAQ